MSAQRDDTPSTGLTMRNTKAEILAAYRSATRVNAHRPMSPMVLARLIACESAVELAHWVIDRESAKACFGGDEHAADTMKAMHLFEDARKLLAPKPR